MKRLTLAALASATALAFAAPAYADFVMVGGSGPIDGKAVEQADSMMNLVSSNTPATTSSGNDLVDAIGLASTIPNGINFTNSNEVFVTASGFATIKPSNDILNTMTYTPTGLDHFTSFTTRGQMQDAGFDVTITVDDNLGNVFTFLETKANQDFDPIGVEAVFGTGEFITAVTVATNDPNGFKEIKQETFGFQAAAVPAPIVGAGLPGLISACVGLWAMQRRRRALNA